MLQKVLPCLTGLLLWILSMPLFAAVGVADKAHTLTIRNKVDLQPIEDVMVYSHKYQFFETTNVRGEVELIEMEASDTLFLQHPSYIHTFTTYGELKDENFIYLMTQKTVMIEEVVVSASKAEEKISEIPNKVELIRSEEVAFRNPQTAADMLAHSGEVFVQKSQFGGGSPVLRGFEANKVLLVLDGIRMNNAIYRGGHLQNSITVDPATLDRTEVVFGPGSVIYGSDALGGVMHFVTQRPLISGDSNVIHRMKAFFRYSSVNHERTGHFSVNSGYKRFGSYTAFSLSHFSDLKMGKKRVHTGKEWGKVPFKTIHENGKDTVVVNEKDYLQINSGFGQFFLTQKFRYLVSDDTELGVNLQYTTTTDIPRFDNLSTFEYDSSRSEYVPGSHAEWFYGPQERLLAAFTVEDRNRRAYDEMKVIWSYQTIEESRVTRRFRSAKYNYNIERVHAAVINADLTKRLGRNTLNYGMEALYNRVNSSAFTYNYKTSETGTDILTRYPAKSNIQQYSAYLMNRWQTRPDLSITSGLRYTQVILQSKFGEQTIKELDDLYKSKKGAVSGSVGMAYNPGKGVELKGILSSGFRMPNVDDYGKVRLQDSEVTVPNLNLNPEYSLNGEVSLVKNIDDAARLMATFYYTRLFNAISRVYSTVDGQDSVIIDNELAAVITNDNINKAHVLGFSFGLHSDIGNNISVTSIINFTKGKDLTLNEPLSGIPPLFGKISFMYHVTRFQAEFYVEFNGQKPIDNYSSSSEDNPDQALETGIPSWYTLNLRTTGQIHENVSLQFAIENILDHHYKNFSSGISAPGRNFVLTLRARV